MIQRIDFYRITPAATVPSLAALRAAGELLGHVEWPAQDAAAVFPYFCSAQLFPRLPTPAAQQRALSGGALGLPCPPGGVLGTVPPEALPRFLADVPTAWDLEPPAAETDLETVVADFSLVIAALRGKPPALTVLIGE